VKWAQCDKTQSTEL